MWDCRTDQQRAWGEPGHEFYLRRDGSAYYRDPDGTESPMDGWTNLPLVHEWAEMNGFLRIDLAIEADG